MANIIHQRKIFPELIQQQATSFNMTNCLLAWLKDYDHYKKTIEQLSQTKNMIKGDLGDIAGYLSSIIQEKA